MERIPYKDLYVYLVNGQIEKKEEACMGEQFLGNWVEEGNSFLFFSNPANEKIAILLKTRPDLGILDNFYFSYEQWQGGELPELRVDDFIIVPPWLETEESPMGIRILMDPGVVFGNGLHPTTRDCLRAIALTKKQKPFRKVLDLGTGTGLLSLAAARLGSRRVVAVDLNLLAARTAVRNVKLNQLQNRVVVVQGNAEDVINYPADLVIANIHYDVMRHLINAGGFVEKKR